MAELLGGIAEVLWVLVAFAAILVLRSLATREDSSLTAIAVSSSGVKMEFAARKIEEALAKADADVRESVGAADKSSAVKRLERHKDVLACSNILWVDDHPENNEALVELLREFGATVDTVRSNTAGCARLQETSYDVIITDVGRDSPKDELAGIDFAETVRERTGQRVILYIGRFNPATVPRSSSDERLALVERVQNAVFARTNRADELLHYIVDVLERLVE